MGGRFGGFVGFGDVDGGAEDGSSESDCGDGGDFRVHVDPYSMLE